VNGIDIALLKLDNPALAKDIRPVDISLRFPAESATLYAMGYPLINASEPNNTFTEQPVQLIAAPPDGSIEVRQAIYGGNSGGPLMDPTGSVIGTCRESVGIGATVARYIAMSDAVDVLNLVPMSERISVLDQRVLGSQISEPELKALLIKSSTTPTNIELYEWARHIIANRNQYTSASTRKLLQCPIKALMQRGMDDLVLELSNFGNEQVVGDANMNVAQRELARGRPLLAETHIQKAAASYQAVGDQVGITRASLLSASSELATGSLAGARAESNKVLTKIDLLSASEKAEAFATSAKIDLATGDTSAAIEKFGEASSLFIHSGRVSSAAEMLLLSADASLKVGKSQDAARSLTEAFQLFKEGNNEAGAAESVYELVKVDTVVGDKVAMQDNLHKYLDAAPSGIHAPEVKEMLEAKPQ
jgi:tetratricopeptide (TPR) repeat protein